MGKIYASIEARMTSSRLPGKVLLPVLGETMLSYLVARLRTVPSLDGIVLATTTNKTDDVLEAFAKEQKISCFRGSEDDVMSRVYGAGKSVGAEVIVEITGDCPVIDPQIIEQTIRLFKHNKCVYATNAHHRSYPDGMDTQVFFLETLGKSMSMTSDPLDHEHVTLHIRNHPEIFPTVHLIAPPELDWPSLGLTLDEPADYELLKKLIEHFGRHKPYFGCGDAIRFLKENPSLMEINKHILRKGDT